MALSRLGLDSSANWGRRRSIRKSTLQRFGTVPGTIRCFEEACFANAALRCFVFEAPSMAIAIHKDVFWFACFSQALCLPRILQILSPGFIVDCCACPLIRFEGLSEIAVSSSS
jgi:hypothetical protein